VLRPLLISLGAVAILYVLFIVALVLAGRRTAAREVATLLPNLALLFKDLLRDSRVPRRSKALLLVGIAWIASPIDLIPEFIPVLGPLDDVVVAVVALRYLRRRLGSDALRERWRGTPGGFALVARVTGG